MQKGLLCTGHIPSKQLLQESDAERLHLMMKADNDSVTRVQFIAPWNVATRQLLAGSSHESGGWQGLQGGAPQL